MAASEGKKRKRATGDEDAGNSKRGAVQGDVKVHYHEPDGVHPVLVSSPGLNTPSIAFSGYTKPLSSHKATKSVKPSTHDLLLHSSLHPRVDYTAFPSRSPVSEQLSHYVGVFDPTTNTLQLIPAHHASLHAIPRKSNLSEEERRIKEKKTYSAQREALGREFGTKKAQKIIASRTENAITQVPNGKGKQSDVQDAILENIAESSAGPPQKERVQEDLLASKPIPRPNLAAERVEDIYPLNVLIPPNDARLIPVKDWQDAARAGEAIMFSHRFPARRVEAIAKTDDVDRLKALRYLTLLLEFHDALQNAGRSGKKVPKKEIFLKRFSSQWAEGLVDSVRRRFSNERQELAKWNLEYLFTHICALALLVDGFRVDISDLKLDLKFETKQLSQYFTELGAKVSAPTEKDREQHGWNKAQASVARIARLKVPPEFPKPRVGRR